VIEIRHKETGAVLHQVEADTLEGARLSDLYLCGADLAEANLAGANLSGAVCRATDFRGAHLAGANLAGAYLFEADLRGADLSHASLPATSLDSVDLSGANLTAADLTGSYLAEAKLVRATLTYANLQSTYLSGADLSSARMAFTVLADCPSLYQAAGLGEIEHLGPSGLDLGTLRVGVGALPDAFLEGAGLAREEVRRLRALFGNLPPYLSCLLAYAPADSGLAGRLRTSLTAHNVRCWRYPVDLGGGYVVQVVFGKAMKQHDRVVFLCSRHSLRQPDLLDLLAAALEREQDTGTRKLFPVIVDDFVLDLPGEADEKRGSGERRAEVPRVLQERATFDFRNYPEETAYRAALTPLLAALANPGAAPQAPR
jgi:TIR domain/Pentapeptide repeats (8 copies)